MPTIGTRSVNLHTVDRDETVYAAPSQTVSHKDNVALRRTVPKKPTDPLRTQMRFEKGFMPNPVPDDGMERSITVSIAATVPPGISAAAVSAYVEECLVQGAVVAKDLASNGDIHLEA